MKKLSSSEEKALREVSAALNAPIDSLRALINFESRWDPSIRNPFTHATGLIQFMPKTARELGYTDENDLLSQNPTIEKQLRGPVYKYLSRYKPFTDEQSLYMSVFYPAARYWPMSKSFSPDVLKVNPGIKTPFDYINLVRRNAGMLPLKAIASFLPLLLIAGLAAYYFIHNRA